MSYGCITHLEKFATAVDLADGAVPVRQGLFETSELDEGRIPIRDVYARIA